MFGLLRLDKKRASDAERALYRAHFCASCHALRAVGGRLAAFTTNYDQTVLALVLGGLQPTRAVVGRACTALPWRTVDVQPLSAASQALLAATNLALVRAKLRDDVEDEKGLVARAGLRLVAGPGQRAEARLSGLGFPRSLIEGLPRRQQDAERAAAPTLASLAAPTAEMLGQVFAHAARIAQCTEHAGDLDAFGGALGRAIYVWDAVVDRERDRRRGAFNAIEATGADERAVHAFLHAQLASAERALARVPLGEAGGLVAGVLATLRARIEAARSRAVRFAARSARSREAGDCDCGVCECCTSADCCADSCGIGGEACTYCTCCDCCPGGSERRSERRKKKAQRGKARRDEADAPDSSETARSQELQALVGASGTTRTELAPDGRVRIGSLDYDARTEGMVLPRGVDVTVRAVDAGVLVVDVSTAFAQEF